MKAADINANFATLKTTIEGINAGSVPEGSVIAYGGTTAPTGWLLCNGQTVSRSTYSALYAVIGTNFGSGDGSTTFHLPDFRGRFLRGVDSGAGNDPDFSTRTAMNAGGNTAGSVGSIQGDLLKIHDHIYNKSDSAGGGSRAAMGNQNDGNSGFSYIGLTHTVYPANLAGNENRPKNAYVNFIIKH